MPYKEHASFVCPSEHLVIWRYMDLAKLLAMFEDEALYFARADLLGDPYEYAIPFKEVASWQLESDEQREELISRLDDFLSPGERQMEIDKINALTQDGNKFRLETVTSARKGLFLSCWHLNKFESAAMWKLYLKSDEGIAIKSTVGKLKFAFGEFKPEVWIGPVKYIDYEEEEIGGKNIFDYILLKRNSFSHEQELRAVTWDYRYADDEAPDGVKVKTQLNELIQDIYVAPSKQDWFLDLVKALVKRFGINAPVTKPQPSVTPSLLSR